jgi:hypothetical protein
MATTTATRQVFPVDELEAFEELRSRAAEDVDRVHRQYRRDLVPLNQAVVLYSEQRRRG